ncbi:hypothetical protein ACHHYP_16563 [Achlya hypogyna]|uniref:Uncharacterized protein n=1 Tax=Achlya hypogyna TaxID=1202772 RepID=A0A1V9ZDZ6_ACHHY|nr:hypothetical protein ACHHYP_16563 [Achlya hypogyna]
MAEGLEVLALRLDVLRCRTTYLTTLKSWLTSAGLNGRLLSRGSVNILVVEGTVDGINKLLAHYAQDPIDLNQKGEMVKDIYFDLLGRKSREGSAKLQGFMDMQNDAMMEKLFVTEWGADPAWLAEAQGTDRSKRFLTWRDEQKLLRKKNRQQAAQERDAKKTQAREAKRLQEDKQAAVDPAEAKDDALDAAVEAKLDAAEENEIEEGEVASAAADKPQAMKPQAPKQPKKPQHQHQQPKKPQHQHQEPKKPQHQHQQPKKPQQHKKPQHQQQNRHPKNGPPSAPKKRNLDPWADPSDAAVQPNPMAGAQKRPVHKKPQRKRPKHS